jgi:hypothetical protein
MSWATVACYCVADGVPRRSLGVALVVGTLLNAINQGDVLLSGSAPDIAKLALTYLVPYAVATYGAVSYRLGNPPAAEGEPPVAAG